MLEERVQVNLSLICGDNNNRHDTVSKELQRAAPILPNDFKSNMFSQKTTLILPSKVVIKPVTVASYGQNQEPPMVFKRNLSLPFKQHKMKQPIITSQAQMIASNVQKSAKSVATAGCSRYTKHHMTSSPLTTVVVNRVTEKDTVDAYNNQLMVPIALLSSDCHLQVGLPLANVNRLKQQMLMQEPIVNGSKLASCETQV
jgi:hypothetical protein